MDQNLILICLSVNKEVLNRCFLHFWQKRDNLTTFLKWITIIRYICNRVWLGQNLRKEGLKIPFSFVPPFYRQYKSLYRLLKLGALKD